MERVFNNISGISGVKSASLVGLALMTKCTVLHFLLSKRPAATSESNSSASDEVTPSFVPSNVVAMRKDYSATGIEDIEVFKDPMAFFQLWMSEAAAANCIEPNAMCLSTCKDNRPSSRFVLLKGFDDRGFFWCTNYNSRKGKEIEENPFGALTFWWGELERSVRIEGEVAKASTEESDAYFASRPRNSQIGAWSSDQSMPVEDRAILELQEIGMMNKFKDPNIPIPRPPHWGGFRLFPTKIEFWKGRKGRMHDRIVYDRVAGEKDGTKAAWTITRLQP